MKIKCLALIMMVTCLGLTACSSIVEAKGNSDTYGSVTVSDDFMSAGFNALEVYN